MSEEVHSPSGQGRRRILFVTPSSPYPPTSGGAQRTALLFAALSEHASVDLFFLGSAAPGVRSVLAERFRLVGTFEDGRLLGRAVRKCIALLSRELRAVLPNKVKVTALSRVLRGGCYDAVVIRYSATACELRDLPRPSACRPVIVDVDDFVAQLLQASARPEKSAWKELPRRVSSILAKSWITATERKSLLQADGLWVNGPTPDWLAKHDRPHVVQLPNIPFNRATKLAAELEPVANSVDFIGVAQFSYPPNEEGFDWFLRQVWPRITAASPDARLRLIGLLPKKRTVERWSKIRGVEIWGAVDDLHPQYAAAKIAIAPIHRGAGTKIKVLEALAMGIPCVCSQHAAFGLSAVEGLLVTEDAEAFAKSCLQLLEEPARRHELASAGRQHIDRDFSLGVFNARVEELLTGCWQAAARRRDSCAASAGPQDLAL